MSSLDVAVEPATSAVPRVPVIAREFVFSGPIIEVRVAADARAGVYEHEELTIPYLQFPRAIPNGRVNLFIHTDQDLRRRTITAQAEVYMKRLADGREYFYLDLKPVDAAATHRLGILPAGAISSADHPDWKVIETTGPVKALIVFADPEAKFPSPPPMERVAERSPYLRHAAPAPKPAAERPAPAKEAAAPKRSERTHAPAQKVATPEKPEPAQTAVDRDQVERLAAARGWKCSAR